jgi:hypothetical protein
MQVCKAGRGKIREWFAELQHYGFIRLHRAASNNPISGYTRYGTHVGTGVIALYGTDVGTASILRCT